MNIFPSNIHDRDLDEQIDFVRERLARSVAEATGVLAAHADGARFLLPLPLHPFHQTLREPDDTWAKESLSEILDSLREALETRLCASLDSIFIPYPNGPKETYFPTHTAYAFRKVIFLTAPLLIKTAGTIAEAKWQEHVPRTGKAKEAWHKTSGILRRITGDVREEIRMMEYAIARHKKTRPIAVNRHPQHNGK